MKRMTAQFFKLNCNKDILYVNSSLILLWPTAILLVTILQLFLPYFKPSSLQDVLYEEQPNAKRLYSVNEETDLGRDLWRGRDCPQDRATSLRLRIGSSILPSPEF